jgi:cell division protein FtsQ
VSDRSGEVEPDAAALDELLRAFHPERADDDEPEQPHVDQTDQDVDQTDQDVDADVDADVDGSAPTPGDVDGVVGGAAVISIADDEMPDPVYVEGDLGGPTKRSGNQGVVFIDNDDTGDALTLDAAASGSGGMEPRIRDRRNAVRRAAGRKRVRWAVAIAAVAAVLVAVLAVLGSPLFSVDADDIRVTGVVYTDRERLQSVIDDLDGTPVLIADTRAAEMALEEIPWVDTARVRTSFPRHASIEIRERTPLATYQGPDGRFRVIDRDGRVLDVLDGQPIAYMLITGPDPIDLAPGAFAPLGYAASAELVQALTASVRGRVTSIDVTSDGSQLRMFLEPVHEESDGEIEVRLGSATELLVKLVRLENVLPAADAEGARSLDVSTAEVTLR